MHLCHHSRRFGDITFRDCPYLPAMLNAPKFSPAHAPSPVDNWTVSKCFSSGKQMGSHMMQPWVSLGHLQRSRLRGGTKLSLFPFQSLPSAWYLVFVGGWEGESRAWTLSFFQICHVPLICKLQEKAIHGLIPQANTGHGSDICSGVPSDTDFAKHGAGHAEAWGLSSCPQVRAFVPRAQLSHCWLFSVCVPNTQCLSFSGTKENRRWHEVSTFSLVNWTAQPEIQVLNFPQQTKGSCSSPVHWNRVTFLSASNPESVCLLILLLSARLGVSSTCKQGKQIEHMTLWMKQKSLRLIFCTLCVPEWFLSLFRPPNLGNQALRIYEQEISLWYKTS